MGADLVPAASTDTAIAAVREFIAASQADATRRAYRFDWLGFTGWCAADKLTPLPAAPETVARYFAVLAQRGRKVSTIRRAAAAITFVHKRASLPNPCEHSGVKDTLSGIARRIGSAPVKKAALTADLLTKLIRKIAGQELESRRDRALILLGFAAALRRSELVALDVRDIARHPKGALITIRRSKTDQAGEGKTKAVPHGRKLNAIAALDAWLVAARIIEGPIFRGVRGNRVLPRRLNDRQVARIIQKRCRAVGLDAALFAGHSLRSGFITTAADAGAELTAIKEHAGHAKVETTVGYVQIADAFRNHPGKGFL